MKRNIILKSLISLTLLLAFSSGYSQKSFGVKFGFSLSNARIQVPTSFTSGDYSRVDDDLQSLPGFHIGFVNQLDLGEYVAIQPGIMLATKGYKAKLNILQATVTSMNYYLEIPIQIMGKYDFGKVEVFGLAGPVLDIGLFGKTKSSLSSESFGNFTNNDSSILGEEGRLKRFDIGLDMGAGVEVMDMLQFSLHYVLGFMNQYKTKTEMEFPPKYHNGSFMISCAFLF
ncbi:MAG: porin family protein [Bacteroidales bacterium]|jgi:hypothetical protein